MVDETKAGQEIKTNKSFVHLLVNPGQKFNPDSEGECVTPLQFFE